MLRGLEKTKNTCYTEVTQALKNLLLIFNTTFTKNLEFRNQKFDLVRLSNYFCVNLIWFGCRTMEVAKRCQRSTNIIIIFLMIMKLFCKLSVLGENQYNELCDVFCCCCCFYLFLYLFSCFFFCKNAEI